jgi:hypothetical protein
MKISNVFKRIEVRKFHFIEGTFDSTFITIGTFSGKLTERRSAIEKQNQFTFII